MAASAEDRASEAILAKISDRAWRMANLYWIKDKYGRKVKFVMNEVQQDLDDHLHTLNLVLKSRQHGVTTWACIRALDICLFRKNTQAGIVAHTAHDAAKFFRSKVLYAYDNLPDWLKLHRKAIRRDMRDGVLELSNGSSLEVSVSHRGGTLQFLHVSEYGPMCAMFPERAGEVASGALNTVAPPEPGAPPNIVVIESTAYGSTGDFAERADAAMVLDRLVKAGEGKLTVMDYRFHFFPWYRDKVNRMDPEGVVIPEATAEYFKKLEVEQGVVLSADQKAWYVKKAADQRDKMNREHPSTPEESFKAATEGTYYGKEMAEAEEQGRICQLPINPVAPVHTFWDIGRSDSTAIWFMQENGPWFDFIDYYEKSGEQVAHFVTELKKRGYNYGRHYWPHDGDNVEWGGGEGKTRKQVAEGLGIKPIKIVERIKDVTAGIDMVRQVLPRCRWDAVRCGPQKAGERKSGIEAMKRYRKEYSEKTETFSDLPYHDWTSNGADAFRQMAQGFKTESGRAVATNRSDSNDSWRTA